MKKLLLTILLTIVSNGVMAEWKYLDVNLEGHFFLYVEPTSIKKKDSEVIVSYLKVYPKPQTNHAEPYHSSKVKVAIDCKEETFKVLTVFYYKDIHGKNLMNDFINNAESSEYLLPPDTTYEKLIKYACSKN